jgi:hypothetical protein
VDANSGLKDTKPVFVDMDQITVDAKLYRVDIELVVVDTKLLTLFPNGV